MKRDSSNTSKLKKARRYKSLPLNQLCWVCDPHSLGLRSTDDVVPTYEIIGQERAIRSMAVGLEIDHKGFNIFATGQPGTGRMTTIKRMLRKMTEGQFKDLRDHCYVHNFKNPDLPLAISLPAGQGIAFRSDMDQFVKSLLHDIPSVYESNRYQDAHSKLVSHFEDRQKAVLSGFEKMVHKRGFELVQVQFENVVRPDIVPVVDGKPSSMEQIEQLMREGSITKEQFTELQSAQEQLGKQMGALFKELRNIERGLRDSLCELDDKFVMPIIDELLLVLKTTYDNPKIHDYIRELREYLRTALDRFRKPTPASTQKYPGEKQTNDEFTEFKVNVLVDNSKQEHSPIIIELNPKHSNLFGTIERTMEGYGMWKTDFTKIKAGSLLRADGGYLVVNALDAMLEPWVWQDLKRTLRNGRLEIGFSDGFIPGSGMKPEPIDINIKVIMIGDIKLYRTIAAYDEEFKRIFKIRADFDYEMPLTKKSIRLMVMFIKTLCVEDKLLPFNAGAIAKTLEAAVRLASDRGKLSTQFNTLSDIIRESHFWARKAQSDTVASEHVQKAIKERIFRVRLYEDKLHEMFRQGHILIDTQGMAIGQVNGLAVFDDGEHAFARPTRITAKTSVGREGVINVEREADLSGPIHDKGIGILEGYLKGLYAQTMPLVMDASVTFEQSYSGIDGDSASSTEIYAILSSLSGIPLRQDIAVTGSVNQYGEIQPIGGVNEKVEGFFDVCRAKGLTGKQGVLIPKQNIKELMLRDDLLETMKKKKFHIYGIATIDQGIEILTGIKAGKKNRFGVFESGTVHSSAAIKLKEFAEHWKRFEQPPSPH